MPEKAPQSVSAFQVNRDQPQPAGRETVYLDVPNAFTRKLQGYAPLAEAEVGMLDRAIGAGRRVAAHHDLIREGDRPGSVFVILSGWACRYKIVPDGSRQITALLMPGDFCDLHVGVLDEMDHAIGTITRCEVATITRERMETLLSATPALTHAFWRAQLVDEAVLRAWIVSMGRRDSMERVAHLMLELYVRMRNVGLTTDGTCELPLTQIVLADALGLTPVHINRVLRSLREQGVMQLGSGTLSLLDIPHLVRIAGFDDNYLHRRLKKAA